MRGRIAELKLFLGIPSAGAPAAPFLQSLATLELPFGTQSFDRVVVTGNYIPAERDLIVERALERGADVLVMCDDDIVLPRDALVRLWATLTANPGAALAGALYYSRDGFRPMVVDRWNERDTRTAVIPAFDRDPVPVDGVGFGCVAMRVSVLHELQPPYFAAHVFVERAAGRVRVCDEDYLFCARLRRAGFGVLLDPGVRCGHYDRLNSTTVPAAWEPPEVTRRVRIAALVNGQPMLIEASEGQARVPESHVRADVEYILVP
jgi:GT2 family glycosyltransferase